MFLSFNLSLDTPKDFANPSIALSFASALRPLFSSTTSSCLGETFLTLIEILLGPKYSLETQKVDIFYFKGYMVISTVLHFF